MDVKIFIHTQAYYDTTKEYEALRSTLTNKVELNKLTRLESMEHELSELRYEVPDWKEILSEIKKRKTYRERLLFLGDLSSEIDMYSEQFNINILDFKKVNAPVRDIHNYYSNLRLLLDRVNKEQEYLKRKVINKQKRKSPVFLEEDKLIQASINENTTLDDLISQTVLNTKEAAIFLM